MWNFRMPVFSIKWSSRAVIHFCVLYMGDLVFGNDLDRMSMFHFHIRQPLASSSGVPRVALQCLHITKLSCVPSFDVTYLASVFAVCL